MNPLMMKNHWTVVTPFRWLVWWCHFRGEGGVGLGFEGVEYEKCSALWCFEEMLSVGVISRDVITREVIRGK